MVGKYEVITLCGSTKFKEDFIKAQEFLTLTGCIVISVGLFGHADKKYETAITQDMKGSVDMTIAECQVETQKHIERVRHYIRFFADKLTTRGVNHDRTKLEPPEVEVFAEHTPKLANLGYDTPEYKASLKAMGDALTHHYAQNRHHPEHFSDGILDMNLVDIVEMFCDWKAATERHHDGNLLKSIAINAQRFGYDDQLKRILLNTAKLFDECE